MDEVELTDEGKARGVTIEGSAEGVTIKPQTLWVLDLKDIETPEDLLRAFKAMQTTFTIVEDSEVWHSLHEQGVGHLLKLQKV